MSLSPGIRAFHRWTSVTFTATVAANFIGIGVGQTPPWLVYSPLPFLFLLMGTGLYMFARPYFVRRGATG